MRIEQGSIGSVVIVGTPSVSISGGTLATNPTSDLTRYIGTQREFFLDRIRNGKAFALGVGAGNVAGNYSMVQLKNPTGSGVTVIVRKITVVQDTQTNFRINRYDTDLASDDGAGNCVQLGSAAGAAHVRHTQGAAQLGTTLAIYRLAATTPYNIADNYVYELPAGTGILCCHDTQNSTQYATFEWLEV